MVTESLEQLFVVDLATTDYTTPAGTLGIIVCEVAGDVAVEYANGQTETKAMVVGEEWRRTPKKILKTGTTATVRYGI